MERNTQSQTVAVTDAIGTTPAINKSGMKGGTVFVPVGSTITTLTWHGAPHVVPLSTQAEPGDFTACYNQAASAAIAQTVAAGRNYPLPAELESIPFLKAVANAAGSVVLTFSS